MTNNEKIKLFVIQTLGCACPEEVFQYIDCQHNIKLNDDILLHSKINIGNRLLIYVVEMNSPDLIKRKLPILIQTGKKERDSSGFNRFRLAIVTDKVDQIKHVAGSVFENLKYKDEKIHLHIIHK
ncbi:MAG: hypothetical protein NT055_10060, partial [Nitrospirae bacterium]|nr:hypothetical protein [Nitrospirota bacterium]